MFTITGDGYQMTFANGWTVSVQWNLGSYTDDRHTHVPGTSTKLAEIWRWPANGQTDEDVCGWQTPDEVAAYIAETAGFERR